MPPGGGIVAQVNDRHFGRLGRPVPLGEAQSLVTSVPGVDMALQRRCGRYQNDGNMALAGAHNPHITGMIDDPLLLLVSRVVFFIDDNQAEIGDRQEQS